VNLRSQHGVRQASVTGTAASTATGTVVAERSWFGGGRVSGRVKLYVVSVAAAVTETVVVAIVCSPAAAALGPQVSAPAPLDMFHDLRWISTHHNSWLSLAAELITAIGGRSLFGVLVAHWIVDQRPTIKALARMMVFYTVMAVLLTPWVGLLFGVAVTHLSYLFLAGVPPALLLALVTHRGVVFSRSGWWMAPSRQTIAAVAVAIAGLTAAGAVISVAPLAVGAFAAAAAGALNARAAIVIVDTRPATMSPRRSRVRLHVRLQVPVAVAAIFALALGGATAAFAAEPTVPASHWREVIPARATGRPVLIVAGFGSRWAPAPPLGLPPRYVEWRYSYRGIGPHGRVLAYGPTDTDQAVTVSARRLQSQVAALFAAYHQPVDIVAESEGSILTRDFLLHDYRPASHQIDDVVLLDLPQGQTSATYPSPGHRGWGVASGDLLDGLASVINLISPLHIAINAPLFHDLSNRRLMTQIAQAPPPPGVHEVAIDALADALDNPYPHAFGHDPTIVVPAAHGGLINNQTAQAAIRRAVTGRTLPNGHTGIALDRILAATSAPWQTPPTP